MNKSFAWRVLKSVTAEYIILDHLTWITIGGFQEKSSNILATLKVPYDCRVNVNEFCW